VLVEQTSRIVSSCEFEVDRSATEFDSAALHGCYKRTSYPIATLVFSDIDVT